MEGIGRELFRIRANEVNTRKDAHLHVLINCMQEAAWNNAADLGFSVYELLSNNITWVIQGMNLNVLRLPKHGEEVSVETWPSGLDKYYVYRDFRIYVGEELICEATSRWLVFDVNERKMIAVPPSLIEAVPSFNHDNLPHVFEKIPISAEYKGDYEITVGWHHLDANGHVNNAMYFQWMLESLPWEVLSSKALQHLEITFRSECSQGDKLMSQSAYESPESSVFLHRISKLNSDKEVILARSVWS